MTYIIHTGWWSDVTQTHEGALRNASDNRTRSPEFLEVWYECVRTFTLPQRIILVDSASPVRPPLLPGVEVVSLVRNFFHAEKCDTHLCGWTRAFMLGAMYALMNDADYSVFVEQDCLLVGGGIVEQAIASMESAGKRITFGALPSLGAYVEQSFVIVRRDYILEFLRKYVAVPGPDNPFTGLAPELKFRRVVESDGAWHPLPFGYGRERPINYRDAVWYSQHLTSGELQQLHRHTGLASLGRLLSRG
jgi:hypothetical protein